jgi:xanthine dehydrogenase accessory factor
MCDVLPELMAGWRAGEAIGVGTVVGTRRAAPRPPGVSMLVGPDGSAVGSVSGGCVQGAVYGLAGQVVADGHPVLQRYGVSHGDAFAVGLTRTGSWMCSWRRCRSRGSRSLARWPSTSKRGARLRW